MSLGGARRSRGRPRWVAPSALLLTRLLGCQQLAPPPDPDASAQPALISEVSPGAAVSAERSSRPVQELTPELIRIAEKIMKVNSDAPIGKTFAFDVDGRRYLARIEEHEDAVRGAHRGVTLYHLD